jgi:hypothetical protein
MDDGSGLLRLKTISAQVWGGNSRQLGYIRMGCGQKSAAALLMLPMGRKYGGRLQRGLCH